jgi:XTP/dITP diphosphohydrolase
VRAPVKLYLASSNAGKLAEFRALAQRLPSLAAEVAPLAEFDSLPGFAEAAPTFAENATGKALHYSKFHDGLVFADDSGLVVPALGGAPGVHSARYAGTTATSADRISKLLNDLRGRTGAERRGHFACAIALARGGRALAIVTDRVDGQILPVPRGDAGFGYDPVFFFPPLGKTFAELSVSEKNQHSHRGKAFSKFLHFLHDK